MQGLKSLSMEASHREKSCDRSSSLHSILSKSSKVFAFRMWNDIAVIPT